MTPRGRERLRPVVADPVLVAAIAVAALPVVVMAARQMVAGWAPVDDDAVIFTRSLDVLSTTPPLVGQYTLASAGDGAGAATYSPGPLGYQVLALPARILPSWALPGIVGLLNVAAFALLLTLVRRRGGRGLVVASAVGLVGIQRSLGAFSFVEIWNPHMAMASFAALTAVCWAVAAGDRWLLPVGVFLASFVVQLHLTYAAPGLALLTVAVVGGWGPTVLGRLRHRQVSWTVAPLVVAAVVALACWTAPLYEQVTRDPGNLGRIVESNRGAREHFGAGPAKAAIADTYGVPPSFVRSDADRLLIHPGGPNASVFGLLSAGVAVGAAAVAGALALGRRDRGAGTGSAVALVLVPALAWVVAVFPLDRALAAVYSFRWFTVAGAALWLAVLGGLWRCFGRYVGERLRPCRVTAVTVVVLALAAVVAVGVGAAPYRDEERLRSTYSAARDLGSVLDARTSRGGRYLVVRSGVFAYSLDPAMIAHLRRSGRDPVLDDDRILLWGRRYAPDGTRCDGVLELLAPGDRLDRSTVVGSTTVVLDGERRDVRLSLSPDDSPDGAC